MPIKALFGTIGFWKLTEPILKEVLKRNFPMWPYVCLILRDFARLIYPNYKDRYSINSILPLNLSVGNLRLKRWASLKEYSPMFSFNKQRKYWRCCQIIYSDNILTCWYIGYWSSLAYWPEDKIQHTQTCNARKEILINNKKYGKSFYN